MITYRVKESIEEPVSQDNADIITAETAMAGILQVLSKVLLSENIKKKESLKPKISYSIKNKQQNGRKIQSLFPKHLKNQL